MRYPCAANAFDNSCISPSTSKNKMHGREHSCCNPSLDAQPSFHRIHRLSERPQYAHRDAFIGLDSQSVHNTLTAMLSYIGLADSGSVHNTLTAMLS
eukprot:3814795-Amphidinium_carterae.2